MKSMEIKEAIKRIKEHIEIHYAKEPRAIYVSEALYMGIDALKKQMPVKPIGKHTSYKCPVCDRRVRSGKGSSSFGIDHFCQRCGQKIDWSDSE